jgi:hypothetical protein
MVRDDKGSKWQSFRKKVKDFSREEIYLIEWEDAYEMESGWQSLEDAQKIKPQEVCSTGYIIYSCDQYVVLAADLGKSSTDTDCGRVTVIPGQWIKKKVQVK